jgi:hypothetical protein
MNKAFAGLRVLDFTTTIAGRTVHACSRISAPTSSRSTLRKAT